MKESLKGRIVLALSAGLLLMPVTWLHADSDGSQDLEAGAISPLNQTADFGRPGFGGRGPGHWGGPHGPGPGPRPGRPPFRPEPYPVPEPVPYPVPEPVVTGTACDCVFIQDASSGTGYELVLRSADGSSDQVIGNYQFQEDCESARSSDSQCE